MNKFDQVMFGAFHQNCVMRGDNFVVYPCHETTMKALDERIVQGGTPDRYTVIALEQTKGEGSTLEDGSTRKWWSTHNVRFNQLNLLFSEMYAALDHEHCQNIELLATYSTAQVVAGYLKNTPDVVELSYPNGVLVNGKKVAGAKAWAKLDNFYKLKFNCGVGINVNLAPPATVAHDGAETTTFSCLYDLGVEKSLGTVLADFNQQMDANLSFYRAHPSFQESLVAMGFADPKTYQLKGLYKANSAQVVGRYEGFETRLNRSGVGSNCIHILNDTGHVTRHAVRDIRMIARIDKEHLNDYAVG